MRRALVVGVATAGIGALALACFSERSGGPGISAGVCQVPVTTVDSMHFLVAIRDFAFHPDSIDVPVGATVTWINCEDTGQETHTTTSDSSGVWASADLNAGARFSHQFPSAGTFPYHCTPHPFMLGKVVVQ